MNNFTHSWKSKILALAILFLQSSVQPDDINLVSLKRKTSFEERGFLSPLNIAAGRIHGPPASQNLKTHIRFVYQNLDLWISALWFKRITTRFNYNLLIFIFGENPVLSRLQIRSFCLMENDLKAIYPCVMKQPNVNPLGATCLVLQLSFVVQDENIQSLRLNLSVCRHLQFAKLSPKSKSYIRYRTTWCITLLSTNLSTLHLSSMLSTKFFISVGRYAAF